MAGEIVHIEFPSQDADRAAAFWGGLFGWQFGESMSPDFVYRMASTGANSGVAVMPSDDRGHPNFYFDTPDLEASMAKVRGARRRDRRQDAGPGTRLVLRVQGQRGQRVPPLAGRLEHRVVVE